MRIPFVVAALAAATAISPVAAATNLVVNGSFESSTFTAPTEFGAAYGGQGVTGWTSASTKAFNLYLNNATATKVETKTQYTEKGQKLAKSFTASPDGGNFVALDGSPGARGALTQVISNLVVGKVYDVSFDWGATQMQDRSGATTESLQVSFGNATQSTAVLKVASQGFTGWMTQTFQFTATGTSQVLSFLSVGTPSGLPPMAVLDGVSVMTAAVPEPATWAMLITGFGMVGFAARRRRSALAA